MSDPIGHSWHRPALRPPSQSAGSSSWLLRYSDEQLRLAARLYYVDGLGQTEVAKFVKVSQAKVSRLLALARERGIVRISVAEYDPRDRDLENAIRERYRLSTVIVIKTLSGATPEEARRAVGHFGAAFVSGLLPAHSVVAVAGGRTIQQLVQVFPEDPERHLSVVQAMGSIDSTVGSEDALELGRVLSRRTGGTFFTFNTPAFVPDKRTRDAFLALSQIDSVRQRLAAATVAVVGIGTLGTSVFVDRGVLPQPEIGRLQACGAVGEVCGRFYDRQGRECNSPWRERVLSIELDQLRRIPQVIGVVGGGDRSEAIAAAIAGGLLKALVIDSEGAAALLKPGSPAPKPQNT